MNVSPSHYPMRKFIRRKAKEQLLNSLSTDQACQEFDQQLFGEIAANIFTAQQGLTLDQPCQSRREADEVENRLVAELVTTYQQIKLRQQDPLVQSLNALLG